jgi:hypothetical protein
MVSRGHKAAVRSTPSIFKSGALAALRSADLRLAWLDAANDAHEAYAAWRDADRDKAVDAFVVYQAAVDQEEAAARALQLQIGAYARSFR